MHCNDKRDVCVCVCMWVLRQERLSTRTLQHKRATTTVRRAYKSHLKHDKQHDGADRDGAQLLHYRGGMQREASRSRSAERERDHQISETQTYEDDDEIEENTNDNDIDQALHEYDGEPQPLEEGEEETPSTTATEVSAVYTSTASAHYKKQAGGGAWWVWKHLLGRSGASRGL